MKLQITLKGDVNYNKTLEKLKKSPIVSFVDVTERGIIHFQVKEFPNDYIQITPRGRVIIFTNNISTLFERFIPYINILSKVIVGKKGKYWTFEEETYNLTGVTYKDLVEISKRIKNVK